MAKPDFRFAEGIGFSDLFAGVDHGTDPPSVTFHGFPVTGARPSPAEQLEEERDRARHQARVHRATAERLREKLKTAKLTERLLRGRLRYAQDLAASSPLPPGLLRKLLKLAHPDHHPEGREALATEVTDVLLKLRNTNQGEEP